MRRARTSHRFQPAFFLLIAAVASPALADIGLTPANGVSLSQEVYTDDTSNNVPVTTVYGTVSVNVSTLGSTTGLSSGYINVGDGGDWVVQNLPVSALGNSLSTSFVFNGFAADNPSNGGVQQPASPISMENLSVDYTPTPLPGYYPQSSPYAPPSETPYPSYQPSYPYPSEAEDYQFCGLTTDESDYPYPPRSPNSTPPSNQTLAVAMQNGIMPVAAAMPNVAEIIPNLNAADQQCVPAAFSNDLAYVSARYGVALPAASVYAPGRYGAVNPATLNVSGFFIPNGKNQEGPPFVQNEAVATTLVGQLDQDMARFNASRSPNAVGNQGVAIGDQLSGLTDYMNTAGLGGKFGVQVQGVDTTKTPFNNNGISVTVFNSAPTFQFIYNALASGDSVEGNYNYGGAGGHAVDIIGAGVTPAGMPNAGVPWIQYQSDWVQTGNEDPNDNILAPIGTFQTHYSLVYPSYVGNNFVLGSDGLWLPGEGDAAGNQPILTDLTTIYYIPEPGSLLLFVGGSALMLRRRRRVAGDQAARMAGAAA